MSRVSPKVYVINLDRSPERLQTFIQSFGSTGLEIVRVSAVDGSELALPHPDYDDRRYRLYQGRRVTSMGIIGCYFSHINALRQFLESDEETALICEDDVSAKPELPQVLREVLSLRKHWDFLRLNCEFTTKNMPVYIPIKKLGFGYRLTVPTYYMPGAGAYLVNRKAAERMIKFLLPMYLPWDHAFEQNWRMGLTTMMVVPFPIELNEHKSHSVIGAVDGLAGGSRHDRLPFLQRYLLSPMLPYRGLMTCQRWRKQLGTALWYRLFPPSGTTEAEQ